MAARKRRWAVGDSRIERLLEDPGGFALPLTPVQRAIARAIDGVPLDDLWKDAGVREAFRCKPATELHWHKHEMPRPFEVCIAAGIRGAKTMTGGSVAVDRAIHCDLSWWHEAETPPIVPLLATHKRNANAAFSAVRRLLTKKGSIVGDHYVSETKESITVRHADKPECEIEIVIVAGSRAGSNLESFWLASCIFDEAFKMQGRDESVINLEDAQTAVSERILPGGQIIYIGSPWSPSGPAWKMTKDHWGKSNSRIVVVRARGPLLNPKWWTEERLERLRNSTKKNDRENYITSGLGEFLDSETSLISSPEVLAVTRTEGPEQLPPRPGIEYVAAMDPAAKKNSWTLAIGSRTDAVKVTIDAVREWLPTAATPLDPEIVLGEIAMFCKAYRITRVWTDRWSVEAMKAVAARYGLILLEHPGNDTWELYDTIRVAVVTKAIELPPDEQVRLDLIRIVKRPTSTGMKIILPTTADGRHCDYAPPLALILSHTPQLVTRPASPVETDETRLLASLERQQRDELEGIGGRL